MSACARHLAIAAAAVVASGAAASRAEAAEAVSALSRLAWLSGIWRGQALGGEVEDVYQPLASGEILSTFHLVVNGQTARYELRRIHADGDRIVLQELAFGPSLMPLAAIPDRALKRIDATTLEFEGLTLRHTGPDSMIETLTVPTGNNGPARTLEIRYARALVFRPPHGPAGASAASQ